MNAQEISSRYGTDIAVIRWAATVIDYFLLVLIGVLTFAVVGEKYVGIGLVAIFLFLAVQYIFLEGFLGCTIGKFICRIKVVDINFNPPGLGKAIIRTLLRLIDTNPLLMGGLPAGIAVIASRNRQRLGDMAAGTYVLRIRDLNEVNYGSGSKNQNGLAVSFIAAGIAVGVIVVTGIIIAVMAPKVLATIKEERLSQPGKVLTSQDNRFQFSVPSGWSIDNGIIRSNRAVDFAVSNIIKESYVMVIAEDKKSLSKEMTLERYTEKVQEKMGKKLQNSETTDIAAAEIDGNSALQFTVAGEDSDVNVKFSIFTVETAGNFYQILGWTSTSSYESNKDEIEKIIRSFKVK